MIFIMHSLASPIILLAYIFPSQASFPPSCLSDVPTHTTKEEVSSVTKALAQKFFAGQITPDDARISDSNLMVHKSSSRWPKKYHTPNGQVKQHQEKRIFLDLNAPPEEESSLDEQIEPLTSNAQAPASSIKEKTSRPSLDALKTPLFPPSRSERIFKPIPKTQPCEGNGNGPKLDLSPNGNGYTKEFLAQDKLSHSQAAENSGRLSTGPDRPLFFLTSRADSSRPSTTIPPPARPEKNMENEASSEKEEHISSSKEPPSFTNKKRKARSRFRNSKKRPYTLTSTDGSIQITPVSYKPAQTGGNSIDSEISAKLSEKISGTKGRSFSKNLRLLSSDRTNDCPSASQNASVPPPRAPMNHASTPAVDLTTPPSCLNGDVNILYNSNSAPKVGTQVPDIRQNFLAAENSSHTNSETTASLGERDSTDTDGRRPNYACMKSISDLGNSNMHTGSSKEMAIENSVEVKQNEDILELPVETWFQKKMEAYDQAKTDEKPKVLQKTLKVIYELKPVMPKSRNIKMGKKPARSNLPLWSPWEIMRDQIKPRRKSTVHWYCYLYLRRFLTSYFQTGFRKHITQMVEISYDDCSELKNEVLIMQGIAVLESIQGNEKLTKLLSEAKYNSFATSEADTKKSDLLEGDQSLKGIQAPIYPEEHEDEPSGTSSISELRATIHYYRKLPTTLSCSVDSTILYFSYLSHMHEMLDDGTIDHAGKLHNLQQKGINFLMDFWRYFFMKSHQREVSSEKFLTPLVKSTMSSMEEKMMTRKSPSANTVWTFHLLQLSLSQDDEFKDFSDFFFAKEKMGKDAFAKFVTNQAISELMLQDLA